MNKSGAGRAARFTTGQRYAIGENVRLFALLSESKTPHAKELAMIVLTRIKALAEGCDVDAPGDEELLLILDVAMRNITDEGEIQ